MEILTSGLIRVGWATLSFSPSQELGNDENSWSYDCHNCRKYHAGALETYGKPINVGDVVGCMLDLHDKTISFSLNGELLLDPSGGEMAFAEIPTGRIIRGKSVFVVFLLTILISVIVSLGDAPYVPAMTLGLGQKVRLIFGQDINALKFFTLCGLQEGYQPFCVNMNRNMTFWYNKDEPVFVEVDDNSNIEVTRIPAGSDSPPSLKLSHKLFEVQEKASWEFMKLSLPVTINDQLIDDLEKSKRWEEVRRRMRRSRADRAGLRHPANLEHHMLQSGFSISDVKDLQRTYSEADGEEGGETPTPQPRMTSPWTSQPGNDSLLSTQGIICSNFFRTKTTRIADED